MKVKVLIKELQKCDPDLDVVVSIDAEGNAFKPLVLVQECMVEISRRKLHSYRIHVAKEQAALVLWPED
jgi:hypothetical protein